jgi:hypothetical protein
MVRLASKYIQKTGLKSLNFLSCRSALARHVQFATLYSITPLVDFESFFFVKKMISYYANSSIYFNSRRNKQCSMFYGGDNAFCITSRLYITRSVIVSVIIVYTPL